MPRRTGQTKSDALSSISRRRGPMPDETGESGNYYRFPPSRDRLCENRPRRTVLSIPTARSSTIGGQRKPQPVERAIRRSIPRTVTNPASHTFASGFQLSGGDRFHRSLNWSQGSTPAGTLKPDSASTPCPQLGGMRPCSPQSPPLERSAASNPFLPAPTLACVKDETYNNHP